MAARNYLHFSLPSFSRIISKLELTHNCISDCQSLPASGRILEEYYSSIILKLLYSCICVKLLQTEQNRNNRLQPSNCLSSQLAPRSPDSGSFNFQSRPLVRFFVDCFQSRSCLWVSLSLCYQWQAFVSIALAMLF